MRARCARRRRRGRRLRQRCRGGRRLGGSFLACQSTLPDRRAGGRGRSRTGRGRTGRCSIRLGLTGVRLVLLLLLLVGGQQPLRSQGRGCRVRGQEQRHIVARNARLDQCALDGAQRHAALAHSHVLLEALRGLDARARRRVGGVGGGGRCRGEGGADRVGRGGSRCSRRASGRGHGAQGAHGQPRFGMARHGVLEREHHPRRHALGAHLEHHRRRRHAHAQRLDEAQQLFPVERAVRHAGSGCRRRGCRGRWCHGRCGGRIRGLRCGGWRRHHSQLTGRAPPREVRLDARLELRQLPRRELALERRLVQHRHERRAKA